MIYPLDQSNLMLLNTVFMRLSELLNAYLLTKFIILILITFYGMIILLNKFL